MKSKTITRRTLIKRSAFAAIGSSLFFSAPFKLFGRNASEETSKVILIRNKEVLKDGKPDGNVLEQMMDKAVLALTGKESVEEAWASILKPEDTLGIKTNVWNHLRTPEELEAILAKKAMGVGIPENKIAADDRGVLRNSIFQNATALINVRPMRTHAWSGVGSLLKNYIMFSPKPSSYHPDSCADLAKLWELPEVAGKTRLNILVMLTPLFHGVGPHHFNKAFTWEYNGLLVGFDPVAVDATGLRILQAKRTAYFKEETPLNPPAKHILLADTRHGLGTADPGRIDLVRIGDDTDSLI